jgi:hypothetical protein
MLDDDISRAIMLLKDDNLVWSADFESIRKNLAGLLARAIQTEYYYLEPEIGDLALNLIRERETHAGESTTTRQAIPLQDKGATQQAGEEGSGCSGVCSCKPRLD